MKFNSIIVVIIILQSFLGLSQDMKEGFTYLETGKYKEAVTYFESILETYPENKTARLCYGRAVGLQGDAKKAVAIFETLLKEYPQDFEIQLNYAESLLWDKKYIDAKSYYETLLKKDDKNFPTLLGYANTLSNLKIYDTALEYVNKALTVSPGNANALVSKKYIYLGYANQYVQSQEYDTALGLLQENITVNPSDKETLLNIANVYLITSAFAKAKTTYQTIEKKDSIVALNGLALVSHLEGKDKEALKISKKAMALLKNETDETLRNQTVERFAQALLWNKKYKNAGQVIDSLTQIYPTENWVRSLRATQDVYKGDFKNALVQYDSILKKDSLSFDGNLGKANVQKALGLYTEAYASAAQAYTIFGKQKDVMTFTKTLDKQFTPVVETRTSYSFDNGDNEATTFLVNASVPLSTKLKVFGAYQYRDAQNTVTNSQAKASSVYAGFTYEVKPRVLFNAQAGITDVTTNDGDYSAFLTDVSLSLKPGKLQTLDLGYKREWEDFNADLLRRAIAKNTLYGRYNLSTNANIGWYTQYNFTFQNDDNQKHLLFTSLYYSIFDKPLLKTGINYQFITFKDQVPTIYFSPESFNVVEVFVDLLKNQKGKWFYNLNAATGLQFIEDQEKQATYRFQGKLGYNFSPRLSADVYGLHSNIASATASGFRFTEVGVHLKWNLTKKPIFRKVVGE
jgi:tetratricopeptide (TPR) repeat protein